MAPLVLALAGTSDFASRVCVTGQHRGMLDDVMSAFALVPDYDLDVMQPDQSLAGVFTAVMNRLDPILCDFQPDWVLVQGDTATSTAAATTVVHQPFLSPTAVCVTFCVRTI